MSFLKRRLSRFLATVCAITLVSGGLVMGAPLAYAADNDIVVAPADTNPILSYDGTSETLDKQLVQYGQASLNFKWFVPSENLSNFGKGDKFTIDLGPFFYNKEFGPQKRVPLVVNTGQTQETIGICTFERATVTCTFDDNVDRLKGSFDQFRGTLTVRVYVQKTTSEETVPITIQNQIVQVLLPKGPPKDGNSGVGIGTAPALPADVYKAMTPVEHSKVNNYTIYMSGKKLKDYFVKAGADFRLDDPDMMITYKDSLVGADGQPDYAHTFKTKPHPTDPNKLVPEDPTAWNVYTHRLAPLSTNFKLEDLKPGRNSALRDDQAAERAEVNPGEFELNVEFDKNTPHIAIITLKGPFKENFNYTIAYPTAVTNPEGVQEGSVFSNQLELIGAKHKFVLNRAYAASAEATAEAVPGFGFFKIEKRLAYSNAEHLIKPEHKVTVNYRYELPLPADTYGAWVAPGQLDADRIHGSASCEINFRKTTSCLDKDGTAKLLPKETKVFITAADEDLATVSPELGGLVWSTPTLQIPQGADHVVISDLPSKTPLFVLTNKAESPKGKFAIKKLTTGLPSAVDAGTFSFTYSCQKDQQPPVTGRIDGVRANGAAVESTESFDLGSRCRIMEEQPKKIEGYSLTLPASQEIEIASSTQVVTAEFTNAYCQDKGTFAVKKTVSGLDTGVVAPNFEFGYSCTVPGKTAKEEGKIEGVVAGDPAKAVGRNFPVGTSCVVTEKTDRAGVDGYTLTEPVAQTVNITKKKEVVEVSFENAYSKDMATFDVMKHIEGVDVALAPKFSFDYSCKLPGAADAVEGVIENVPGDGSKIAVGKSFPVNTVCTITEKLDKAKIKDHTLTAPPSQTLTLREKNQTYTATFTNTYTLDKGTFAVKKVVEGLADPAVAPKFSFDYSCTIPGQTDPVEGVIADVTAGGAAVSVGRDFPVHTACTITEKTADAKVKDYTLTEPKGQNIEITTKDQIVEAVFTNIYTLDMGTFAVKKKVEGLSDAALAPKFSFEYSCVIPGRAAAVEGVIKDVPANGSSVAAGRDFPLHTVCTISEKVDQAQVKDHTLTPPAPQKITLENKGEVAEATFTNVYSLDMATFSVKKTTKGLAEGVAVPKFSFDYSCKVPGKTDPVVGSIKDVVAGEKATLVGQSFPLHTVCTVTEKVEGATINGYTLTAPGVQELKLETKDQTLEIEFTNIYKEKPNKPGKGGTSKIAKTGANATVLVTAAMLLMGAGVVAVRKRRK